MKNEERILELIAETLRSIDRHSEQFERLEAEVKRINERLDRHQDQLDYKQEQIDEKREQIWTVLRLMQQHQERLDQHESVLVTLKDRDEAMHQSLLEQAQAYRAMTELIMHHNQILRDKGAL
jgi:chromosome segregation ATPase